MYVQNLCQAIIVEFPHKTKGTIVDSLSCFLTSDTLSFYFKAKLLVNSLACTLPVIINENKTKKVHNMKIERELGKRFIPNTEWLKLGLFSLTLFSLTLITACGGDDNHNMEGGMGPQTREVTGVVSEGTANGISPRTYKTRVLALKNFSFLYKLIAPHSALASGQAGTFRVRAMGRDCFIHEADTNPETGSFTLRLPDDDCYTMSFTAHRGPGMMDEFWDYMVFQCGLEQEGKFHNQFCLSPGDIPVDLGEVTVHSDHRFAMPMHNPLNFVDSDEDGVMDFHDPDYVCGDVEDMNHDGYYDDDSHHNGFHDDDMNHDGFHDGMGPGGGGMGPGGMGPH